MMTLEQSKPADEAHDGQSDCWYMGHEAQEDDHWKPKNLEQGIHRGAFFVKQGFLHPIRTLIKIEAPEL